MAFEFNTFLMNLNSMGFFDFVLPWILFLVIFFVIIVQYAPFISGYDKKKQIGVIIAAILAFFVVNTPLNAYLLVDYYLLCLVKQAYLQQAYLL